MEINQELNEGLLGDDKSLQKLIEKVVHGFVSSLQADDFVLWLSFNEVLQIIQPYHVLIEGNAQLMHYVERCYTHYCSNPQCGLDMNALSLAFPRQVAELQQNYKASDGKKMRFPCGSPTPVSVVPQKRVQERKGIVVPKGTVRVPVLDNLYSDRIEIVHVKSVQYQKSELHMKDLRKSLPFVVYEIGLREASWGRPLGITATALNTDLAEMADVEPVCLEDVSVAATLAGDKSAGILSVQQSDEVMEEKLESKAMTGREIVQQYIKGHFLRKTKFSYLNRAPCKGYDPYHLVVVPRSKIEPEHFVVSTHAILHVMPNHPSELQPLTDWFREAFLFNAIMKFKFFRHFLVTKMFRKWQKMKEVSQFHVLRDQVTKIMIWNVPSFCSALFRISSFIQDLEQVQFLPCEDLSTQPLQKFHDASIKLLVEAQECLKLFFEYCHSVINKTKDNCFEYLEYCKVQLQKKSRDPKESFSLVKKRKEIKKQNLKHACHEVFLLDKFIRLIDQLVAARLLAIARQNIGSFVDNALENNQTKGLFSATLEFDESDNFVLHPSGNTLKKFLLFTIQGVLKILCHSPDFYAIEFGDSKEIQYRKARTETPPSVKSDIAFAEMSPDLSTPSETPVEMVREHAPSPLKVVSILDEKAGPRRISKPNQKIQNLKNLLSEGIEDSVQSDDAADEDVKNDKCAKACVSPTGQLVVQGKEMMTPRSLTDSLAQSKLEAALLKDEQILTHITRQETIVNTALEEVEKFYRDYHWIVVIHKFTRTWNTTVLDSWRGKPPMEIQGQLSQIKKWIEDLRPVAKWFCTQNGLLLVDCSVFLNDIIIKLNKIFRELSQMVAKHLIVMSNEFKQHVNELAQKLSEHSRDPKRFAGFMAVQAEIKAEVPALQLQVEYIKSLFEMIRSSYRQLSRTEEEAEQKIWLAWEQFLLCLQESSDFLLVETSQVLRDLKETIMITEHQARVLGKKAISGEYLIPENDPTMILTQLRQLRQSLWSLLNQLDDLAWCRQVISGEKYDKSELLEILNKVDVQFQLWKYYDAATHTIKEWLQMHFRKMNVRKVTEKISEWQVVASNLKEKLLNGDAVYEAWLKLMESFMKDFPYLQQLSNDALKPRHWKALFIGMGQQYDADYQFTIADLYGFKLGLYKEIIISVCTGAQHEYALELKLRALAKTWTEKEFKLTKHFALDRETESSSKQMSRSRYIYSKSSEMYVLTGDDELKCLIEDDRVTLQLMLVSPYIADLKSTVEMWMRNLEQLEEILELWVACQKKSLYLSIVFNDETRIFTDTEALGQFEDVDFKFKEFANSVVRYPKVLSILSKKRGEKGYRELQGEALRSMLFTLLQAQEELLKSVGSNMAKVRETFPRLYFLSDSEVLDTIVISRDPRKLVPVVRKCFPGIKSVVFSFPKDEINKLDTALDAALNAHLLQAVAINGEFGETMALCEPITSFSDSQTWLSTLEKSIKISLLANFTKCMLHWLSQPRRYQVTAVTDILQTMNAQEDYKEHEKSVEALQISKYPSQCVRSIEAVKWCQDVYRALTCEDKKELEALSVFTNTRVEDYSRVLSGKEFANLTSVSHVRSTLQSLVVCAIHQRDVVKRLLACEAVCAHCFEWQSCLQHHVSLKKIFSTEYCSGQHATSSSLFLQDQLPLTTQYETEHYDIRLLGANFPYGFEYLSEGASLVVTPLTERCFLALTMALNKYTCGVPYGYDDTGKTEIISELAKMMGRHLVFFKCSSFTTSAVLARLLTGVVTSGSWVCFDEAHHLPQSLLHILGEYFRGITESYHYLSLNSQQHADERRGTGVKRGTRQVGLTRSNSVGELNCLSSQQTYEEKAANHGRSITVKKATRVSRRRASITEGRNIDQTRFYQDKQPLPVCIPLLHTPSMTDSQLFPKEDKDDVSGYQQQASRDRGNLVFNGMLLKAHPHAGTFLTITPSSQGYLDVPDNLRVSMRPVAMVVPDMKRSLEVFLLCAGFTDVKALAQKITFVTKMIHDELPPELNVQTSTLKTVIDVAGGKLRSEQTLRDNSNKQTETQVSEETQGAELPASASFLKEFEKRTQEENAVVYGVFTVLFPKLDETCKKLVCDVIDHVFTHTILTSVSETSCGRVVEAVRNQLKAESLLLNIDLVSKVVQLYQVLQTNRAAIIMGKSGTGKTTLYHTLCKAMNNLNASVENEPDVISEDKYPKINLSVLFPRSMTENELFGCIDPTTGLWSDGILVKRARNAEAVKNASESLYSERKQDHPQTTSNTTTTDFHQWIVLDGSLNSGYMDQLSSLFDGSRSLTLANGEMVPLSETLSFLVEVDELQDAPPSLVCRCGIVYCPEDTVGWKSVFKSWLKGAHAKWNVSIRALGILSSLMEHCVEKTLTFRDEHCQSILYANYYDSHRPGTSARGLAEVQRFLAIVSSLFDKHILRDNDETFNILDTLKDQRFSISRGSSDSGRSSSALASDADTVTSSFAYSFIWAFGGDLHESCIETFDEFFKALLTSGPYPHRKLPPTSVFDYHLNFAAGTLLSSTEKLSGTTRTIASSYVVVPRAEVYFSLLDLLISSKTPVLVVGPPGAGKTSFMQHLVRPRFKYSRMSFANGMSTHYVQDVIETKFNTTKRRLLVAQASTHVTHACRSTFFFDDMNAAASDGTTSNNQPLLELLRSLLTLGGVYDRKRHCLNPLSELAVIGAAVSPGYHGSGGGVSTFPISPRLARVMVVLSFLPVSGETLRSIYHSLFQGWLEDFPAYSLTHHHQLAKAISSSTVSLFESISHDLRPTPVHPHYVFTHHDVSRVLQGMMLFSSRTKSRPRPRVRHGRRLVKPVDKSYSDRNVVSPDKDSLQQEISWPSVKCKETFMDRKTPAVLAPLIRVIIRLWCHECTRVFADRLIGEDKLWFSSVLHKTAVLQFCETSFTVNQPGQDQEPSETSNRLLDSSLQVGELVDSESTPANDEESEQDVSRDDSPAPDSIGEQSTAGDQMAQGGDVSSTYSTPQQLASPAFVHIANNSPQSGSPGVVDTTHSMPQQPFCPSVDSTPRTTPRLRSSDVDGTTFQQPSSPSVDGTPQTTPLPGSSTVIGTTQSISQRLGSPTISATPRSTPQLRSPGMVDSAHSTPQPGFPAANGTPRSTPHLYSPGIDSSLQSTPQPCSPRAVDSTTHSTPHIRSPAINITTHSTQYLASPSVESSSEARTISGEMVAHRRVASKQRVVTFEDMHCKKDLSEMYHGPLISTNQLFEAGEDLSRIIFCRHFMSATHEAGNEQDKGYNEYSVQALAEGLQRYQQFYNSQDVQPLDLVFFEQAVRHAARLSRCLSLTSGHSLLLSKSGYGRKDLVLLASFAAHCKLIKLCSSRKSRERMRSALYVTGLLGKPVVLYVSEGMDTNIMQIVCSLMDKGNCPGLFTPDELSTMCAELIPGSQKEKNVENMSIAQERFFRRVRANLHVVVCLQYEEQEIATSVFSRLPFLLTRTSNVDVYQPWYPSVLSKVASLRLASFNLEPDELRQVVSGHHVAVASLMSYIHTSASQLLTQQFGFSQFRCYTPGTIIELVEMFGKCCSRLWKDEQAKIEACRKALAKVDEANNQIEEMQKNLDSFIPILRNADQEVKECLQIVEGLQGDYAEGRENCKRQEVEIEKLMAPIEELERLAKIELDRVSPVFKAAYKALKSLNVYDVEEIRSYRTPPEQVVLVVNAVCLIFGKEESWEEGKLLFSREDFIKDLEFYDMKAISDKTFCRLKDYIDNPKFVPEAVKEGSIAAMSICIWIRAVYNFCLVFRKYFPKQQRVIEAKKILDEAMAFLGDLRVRCNNIKAEAEGKIEDYKEKVHRAKLIEKQIQVTEQRKARVLALIKSMSVYVKYWKKTLRTSQYHMRTLTGDALLLAGCLCYLGPMGQEERCKLLNDWKIACQGERNHEQSDDEDDHIDDDHDDVVNNVDDDVKIFNHNRHSSKHEPFSKIPLLDIKQIPVRSEFSLKEVLSSEQELYSWNQDGLPTNTTAVENALIMKYVGQFGSRHWPLLVDIDLQSYKWIKCLHQDHESSKIVHESSEILASSIPLETPDQDTILSLPDSPYTNLDDSGDDRSTNYEESDSTSVYSSQSGRRTSAATSGPLIREDLKRELDIETSPMEYTSSDNSTSSDTSFVDDQISVISAVDRQRDTKICYAVSTGTTVLLVDIERRKLGSKLNNLLARNTFLDKNGEQKIKIGKSVITYHPCFRLYLYTNMSLELVPASTACPPFKKCLVINMAVSPEGLQEHLLCSVLALERPEYAAQNRALQADIYRHEQEIKNAEDTLFNHVINSEEKLLENTALPEALSECDDMCNTASMQLEESKTLFELAKEKQEDYSHVSEHGAALLTIVAKLSKLNHHYQFPLETSMGIFRDVISQRQRGKRSLGSSLARSAELITYVTRSICSKVGRSLFSDHYNVFTFLVAAEKLHFAGLVTKPEWELFCRLPRRRSSVGQIGHAGDEGRPSWICAEVWQDVGDLDKLSTYRGLKEAVQSNEELWREYFRLPPILMAPTPSNFQPLSVFQRVLLWKVFKRENLHSIAKDLVLYQLGTNAASVNSSVDDAYQDSTCTTPILFFVPSKHYNDTWRKRNLKEPVDEITSLAKRTNMINKLRFITMAGTGHNTANKLRDASKHGLWAVIQNCHVVTNWSSELLDIFHQITLAGSKDQIMNERGEWEHNPHLVTSCVFRQKLSVDPQFRLWMISSADTGLPAVLVRYGIKVAWDDKSDFQSSVRQCFVTACNKQSTEQFKNLQTDQVRQADPLFPYQRSLALLHCLLHERCRYGQQAFTIPYHWHDAEIPWAMETIQVLTSSVLCSCKATTSHTSALHDVIDVLYGGELLEKLDCRTLTSLTTRIFLPVGSSEEATSLDENAADIIFGQSPGAVQLEEIGLTKNISVEHNTRISSQMARDISITHCAPSKSTSNLKPVVFFQDMLNTVKDIKSSCLHETHPAETDEVSAFQSFLLAERDRYITLLNTVRAQLEAVIKGLKGEASFSRDLLDMALVISDGRIPQHWDNTASSSHSISNWIGSLRSQLDALGEYMNRPCATPLLVNPAVFLSKNSFFYAILADWSTASGQALHEMEISAEVVPSARVPQQSGGVYLTGLVLKNASWNENENCLRELDESAVDTIIACVQLKPKTTRVSQSGSAAYRYNCPLYLDDRVQFEHVCPVSYVELCSHLPCHIWEERQVCLTSSTIT